MKLKTTEIKAYREQCVLQQNNECALCHIPFTTEDRIVLDHNHKTGMIRGAIHNGCNMALGKLENSVTINKIDLEAFANGLLAYTNQSHDVLHPTYFTLEEKKERTKAKAKRKRDKAKKLKE